MNNSDQIVCQRQVTQIVIEPNFLYSVCIIEFIPLVVDVVHFKFQLIYKRFNEVREWVSTCIIILY